MVAALAPKHTCLGPAPALASGLQGKAALWPHAREEAHTAVTKFWAQLLAEL